MKIRAAATDYVVFHAIKGCILIMPMKYNEQNSGLKTWIFKANDYIRISPNLRRDIQQHDVSTVFVCELLQKKQSRKCFDFFIFFCNYIKLLQYTRSVTCVAFISDVVDLTTKASDELAACNQTIVTVSQATTTALATGSINHLSRSSCTDLRNK